MGLSNFAISAIWLCRMWPNGTRETMIACVACRSSKRITERGSTWLTWRLWDRTPSTEWHRFTRIFWSVTCNFLIPSVLCRPLSPRISMDMLSFIPADWLLMRLDLFASVRNETDNDTAFDLWTGSAISTKWIPTNSRTKPTASLRVVGFCCATRPWLTLLPR